MRVFKGSGLRVLTIEGCGLRGLGCMEKGLGLGFLQISLWEFPKLGVPYFGVLIIRILLFVVLYWGPPFSETPICVLLRFRVKI